LGWLTWGKTGNGQMINLNQYFGNKRPIFPARQAVHSLRRVICVENCPIFSDFMPDQFNFSQFMAVIIQVKHTFCHQ
jgi:hypothetical protein